MISKIDKQSIVTLSKKYHAKRVLLFGSSLFTDSKANDIDLGVEGIADADYFKFYGDLMLTLSKPVDLIDISSKTKFTDIVRAEGVQIYG